MAKYQGGEEMDYDFVAPVTQESECSVCLQTLRDPQLVSCCGNNFCRACIARIQNDRKPCPQCRAAGFTTMANQDLKRALNVQSQAKAPERRGEEADSRDEAVAVESQCSVCRQTLQDPHLVSCCGHNYCLHCIARIQRDRNPCPLCKQRFTTKANKSLKRALNNSKVRCPHHKLGCEWTGESVKLKLHLNADPQPEHKLEGCQFTSVKCIYCKNYIKRHAIVDHQNEHCPKRPYTCEHCSYKSTFNRMAKHWNTCKHYLLPCPNKCHPLGSGIERYKLDRHVKEECPMIIVECDFHYAGCGMKLPRKDMAVHMREESVAHISLLTAENQRLAKQLLEREKQLQIQQNFIIQRLSHLVQEKNTDQELARTFKEKLTQDTERKLVRNRREFQENLVNSQAKLKVQINYTCLATAAVLILIASVAFGPSYVEHRDLSTNVRQLHEEHRDLVANVTQLHKEHRDLITKHRDLVKTTHAHVEFSLIKVYLTTSTEDIAPVEFKMCGFAQLKNENTPWHSTPFYTHFCGYRMRLKVYANGFGRHGYSTHVSVSTQLMRGEFDSYLKWPFRGNITVQLLNHDDEGEIFEDNIYYNDGTDNVAADRLTVGESSSSWGKHRFIRHSRLGVYLHDDCIAFRVLDFKVRI